MVGNKEVSYIVYYKSLLFVVPIVIIEKTVSFNKNIHQIQQLEALVIFYGMIDIAHIGN
jgi:hypothetical protein